MNLLRYDRVIDQMNTKCGLAQESRSKVSIAIPEQARKPVVYQRQLLQAGVNLWATRIKPLNSYSPRSFINKRVQNLRLQFCSQCPTHHFKSLCSSSILRLSPLSFSAVEYSVPFPLQVTNVFHHSTLPLMADIYTQCSENSYTCDPWVIDSYRVVTRYVFSSLSPFLSVNFWSLFLNAWPVFVPDPTKMVQPDP